MVSAKSVQNAFLCIVVTLSSFVIMLLYAGEWSLWSDDLGTLGFIAEDVELNTVIERISFECGYNPPLFYILAYFWLRIVPYGTVYLKLFNIILCSIGIWLCGIAAKYIKGDRAALIATIIAGTSVFLVQYAAFTFRNFGLLFFSCPLVIICYYKRFLFPERIKMHIFYGLSLALLLHSNYMGILIVGALGLYDCYLFIRKTFNYKFIFSYLLAGLIFLPLLIFSFTSMVELHKNFWPAAPDIKYLLEIIFLIFSKQFLFLFLFGISVVVVFLSRYKQGLAGFLKISSVGNTVSVGLVFWVVFVIMFDFIYSRYINPSGSIFVPRYFVSVLAPIFILSAVGLDNILIFICDGKSKLASEALCIVLLFSVLCLNFGIYVNAIDESPGYLCQRIEQAVDWIYEHESAHLNDSIMVMTTDQNGLWYYVTHCLERESINYGSLDGSNWQNYSIVFASPMHGPLSEEANQILEEYFEEIERNDLYNVVVYSKR